MATRETPTKTIVTVEVSASKAIEQTRLARAELAAPGGMKFDGGKSRFSLLRFGCARAMAGVANVLTFGAVKYAAHSWREVDEGVDRYGRMAATLAARLRAAVDTADINEIDYLTYWSEQTIDRDPLKAPSMIKVYSAGTYTFGEQVRDKTGVPEAEAMWLAAQINACFEDVAPSMLRAMGYLQAVSDVLVEGNAPLCWKTPAGLPVIRARYTESSVRLASEAYGVRKSRTFYVNGGVLSKKDNVPAWPRTLSTA